MTSPSPAEPGPEQQAFRPVLLGGPPDPGMTFDTLIPFRANEFAIHVARDLAERGVRSLYNPMYCYADIGFGKTHLLSAVANASALRTLLVNAADLESECVRSTRQGTLAEMRNWIASHDVVIVDDVQLCEGREAIQHELLAVFNRAMARGAALVLSSDVTPDKLRGMEARLASRLGCGTIVPLCMGDKQERIELLRRLALPVALPAAVLDHLAEHVTDSVRRLKAAAVQILAMSRCAGIAPSIEIARAVVPLPGDLAARPDPKAAAHRSGSRFKQMLAEAETEGEQGLALQLAVREKLRQLSENRSDPDLIATYARALELLREGRVRDALLCLEL